MLFYIGIFKRRLSYELTMKNKEIKKPNIIFIFMDALRASNLGCYGYKRKTSPNIDNLAKQGILFEKTFASNNLTDKSALSILASRHLLIEETRNFSYNKEELKSFFDSGGIFLQEILKKNGYKTYFLRCLYNWRKIGFDYYFKKELKEASRKWDLITFLGKKVLISKILKNLFHYLISNKLANKLRKKSDSEIATKKAIEIIKNTNKKDNFFMWISYEDTHNPYNCSTKFINKFVTKKKSIKFFKKLSKKRGYSKKFVDFCKSGFSHDCKIRDIIDRYDNAIAYNDYLIGKIIKTLKEENLFENTIIVFFSDHGESIYEHKIYVDHHGLYDVSMHVPLIISAKQLPKDKKINSLASLQDITPTILNLINVDYSKFLFDGKSLLPLVFGKQKKIRDLVFMEESVLHRKRAIRTEKYKYMESPTKQDAFCSRCNNFHGGVIELYDLEKDPGENVNIAKKNKKILMEMKFKLDKKVKDIKDINEKRRMNQILSKIK